MSKQIALLLGGAMLLSVPLVSLGQAGGGGGGGFGGGGGGGGAGGGSAVRAAGALYGDLYVIERDGNGEPVLRTIVATGGPYTCQQPIAADCSFLPLNGDKPDFNPEVEDACAVQADHVDALQAVTFGRESVSRAPVGVIDKSYAEALKSINLATPACEGDLRAVKLDPSGRITLCTPGTDPGLYAWKAIDAPLENLGLYRAALTTGCFGPVTDEVIGEEGVRVTVTIELSETAKGYLAASGLGHLVCGATTGIEKADMLSAAVFIAAGADKTTPVTLDQVINVNNYVGVNTWTNASSKKVKTLNITYFPFKVLDGPGGWFAYTKGVDAFDPANPDNTVSLLTPTGDIGTFTIAPVSVFGGSPPGVNLTNVTVCRAGAPLIIESVPVVCDKGAANPVYSSSNILGCGGANWFTQAAEHARKTIWYLHNYEPPVVAY